jgi:beta-glucuronidase
MLLTTTTGLVNVLSFSFLFLFSSSSFLPLSLPHPHSPLLFVLFLPDQQGLAIIDESTAVGLALVEFYNNATLAHHLQVMAEIIRRDKNHPSVLMWNLANEPNTALAGATEYFKTVAEFTKVCASPLFFFCSSFFSSFHSLISSPFYPHSPFPPPFSFVQAFDPTGRPITLVQSVDYNNDGNVSYFIDVVCINRYYAWYTDPGMIDLIPLQLSVDLNGWFAKYGKPMIVR